jgi:hypothetical protein
MLKKKNYKLDFLVLITTIVFLLSIFIRFNFTISSFLILIFLILIFVFFFLFKKEINTNKIKSFKHIIIPIVLLIILYSLNAKNIIETPRTCLFINQLLFTNINIGIWICKYYIIFLLIFFIIVFIFFSLIKKYDIRIIFLNFGLIIFVISIIQLINSYLFYFKIYNYNYLQFIFGGDYIFYWQFLPFALSGSRHYEIIPFILSFIASLSLFTENPNKYKKYVYIFFVSSVLTYSRNLWAVLIFITFFIILFDQKKLQIIKNCYILLVIIIITISQLQNVTNKFYKNEPHKFHTNILDYTILKLVSPFKKDFFLFDNEYYEIMSLKYYGKIDEKIKDNINSLFDSSTDRLLIYKLTIKEILKNPIIGSGLNHYIEIEDANNNKKILYNYESHILTILIEIGLLGLLIYLYLFFYTFTKIKNNKFYLLSICSLLIISTFNSYQKNLIIFYLIALIFSNIIKETSIKKIHNKS